MRRTTDRSLARAAAAAVLAAAVGCGGPGPGSAATTPQAPPPAAVSPGASELRVTAAGPLVSIRAREARLGTILQRLGQRTGLMVSGHGALDERVSVDLRDLPLEKALPKLLGRRGYTLAYGVSRQVTALRVFQSRTPEERWAATFSNPDPQVRLAAVHRLPVDPPSPALAVARLRRALSDPHPAVRDAAMLNLAELGGDAAVAALTGLVRHTDANMRRDAVLALGELDDARSLALVRDALDDRHPDVREAALSVLPPPAAAHRLPRQPDSASAAAAALSADRPRVDSR